MSGLLDVRVVLDHLIGNARTMAGLTGDIGARNNLREGEQARAAIAALIAAYREYDAARIALIDINRHIAEKGWIEIEFDALRNAGNRFVRAQLRRDRALANVGGAA